MKNGRKSTSRLQIRQSTMYNSQEKSSQGHGKECLTDHLRAGLMIAYDDKLTEVYIDKLRQRINRKEDNEKKLKI
jgi:hypothetical protein